MASSRYVHPPELKEDINWLDYKKEVEIWQALTDLPATKQGPSIFFSLQGKAKTAALELDIDDIKKEDGVMTILTKLDKLYLQETSQSEYIAYHEFETFKRPRSMPIKEYLIKFDSLYNKIKKYKMELPDGVLAYRVLNSANLSDEEMRLCRATLNELKYETMTKQLTKIFGDILTTQCLEESKEIKEEPVFEASVHQDYRSRSRYTRGRGRTRGRNQYQRDSNRENAQNTNNERKKIDKALNPVIDGKQTKCNGCGSKFHWFNDCPDKELAKEAYHTTKEEEFVFETTEVDESKSKELVGEAIGCGILDSACSQTVCGETWFRCFKENIGQSSLIGKESSRKFRFGNGKVVDSMGEVELPIKIGNKKMKLRTDIVKSDIPLLISKEAMQKAGTILNFNNDTAQMFGETHKLLKTSSGHYAIPITNTRVVIEENCIDNVRNSEYCMMALSVNDDKRKVVTKLHRQFCHCSSEKLKKLINSSEIWKEDLEIYDLVDEVSNNCEICQMYKKAPAIPVVSLPLANEFNGVVAMDLITIKRNGPWILHLIDVFSRYSVTCIRYSKKQEAIVDAIMKIWISYFGQPRKFLADNGGEFSNKEYMSMCETFNIEMCKTAAESPWSNGLVERHNAIIKRSMQKVMEDAKCNHETALVWGTSSKNTLHGHHGYSPNTIVFGRNPNMPSILNDQLPALNEPIGVVVARNLKAIQSARENVIKCESSEKIKRALRHNVRKSNEVRYENGDKCYYKRDDQMKWHGPGTVIGQHNQEIIVKHGHEIVKVHPSRIVLKRNVEFQSQKKNDSNGASMNDKSIENKCTVHAPEIVDRNIESTIIELHNEETIEDSANSLHEATVENITQESDAIGSDENTEEIVQTSNDSTVANSVEISNDKSSNTINDEVVENESNESTSIRTNQDVKSYPKVKERIQYQTENGNWETGEVLSRGGKAKGKYKGQFNVKNAKSDEISCIDFENVQWEPVTENEILIVTNENMPSINTAKMKELHSWIENDVYTEVKNKNQKAITCRWIITTKMIDGVNITKARLVARGFEDGDLGNCAIDSPTSSKESIRIALAVMSSMEWNCKIIDVKRAFLQGNPLERDVFLKPPKEANTDNLWKLKKAVYGLNEASRKWYNRIKEELLKIGMTKSLYDEALFYYKKKGKVEGILALHVDDMIFGGSKEFEENVVEILKKEIQIGSEDITPFKYLGMNISQVDGVIYVDQESYIRVTEAVDQIDMKDKERTLNENEQYLYRAICGQLNWIATQSRPDISYDVCVLSTKLNSAKVSDMLYANKVLKKVKAEDIKLMFPKLQFPLKLLVFCDASYANLNNGGSQGGYIIFISGSNGKIAPACWSSRRLRRVCRSTLSAETLAMIESIDASVWIYNILYEIFGNDIETTVIKTDNKSLFEVAHSTKASEEKRLRVDIAAIRECILRKEIDVQWIEKHAQLADILTKQGADNRILVRALKQSNLV